MTHRILASILAADFACLGDQVQAVLAAGADAIHFDVMDNHFVPNLTIGHDVCRALRNYGISGYIDVHLMTQPVASLLQPFQQAGANAITFHIEAVANAQSLIDRIRHGGMQVGISLNPHTPVEAIFDILPMVDSVLVMSVEPGFGGQAFLPMSYDKITHIRQHIEDMRIPCRIVVDGGVNATNARSIIAAGADDIVVGSALFGTEDYAKTIQRLRAALC